MEQKNLIVDRGHRSRADITALQLTLDDLENRIANGYVYCADAENRLYAQIDGINTQLNNEKLGFCPNCFNMLYFCDESAKEPGVYVCPQCHKHYALDITKVGDSECQRLKRL